MAKVMLIDDDESLQILIGQIAARDGHEYCCASNGTAFCWTGVGKRLSNKKITCVQQKHPQNQQRPTTSNKYTNNITI